MTSPTALYRRRRRQLIAYGRWEPSIISAGHVAAHVRDLTSQGRSRRWIAQQAGVAENVVTRVASGKSTRVSRDNARKLLAVTVTAKPTGKTWVPGAGTRRRVEALATLGWSHPAIAAVAGLHQQTLTNAVCDPTRVAAATAQAVVHAYDRLRYRRRDDRAGAWVRTRAQRRGFAPPDAWTRHTIDDPQARPLTARTE